MTDATALEHFSMRDENLIVANWTSSEVIYELSEGIPEDLRNQFVNEGEQIYITETSIDYRSMVSTHAVSFDVLAALLIETRDVEFVEDLTNLAFDSTIEITVYDNVNETVSVTTEHTNEVTTYTNIVEYQTYTTTNVYGEDGSTVSSGTTWQATASQEFDSAETAETDYTITTTRIERANSYVVGLTNVSSWIADVRNEYEAVSNVGEEVNLETGESEEYEQELGEQEISITHPEVEAFRVSRTSTHHSTNDTDNTTTIVTNGCNILSAKRRGTLNGIREVTRNTEQANTYEYENTSREISNFGEKFREVYDDNEVAEEEVKKIFDALEEKENSVEYIPIIQYLIFGATGEETEITEEEIIKELEEPNETISYKTSGNLSAFGCTMTKEQFVTAAKAYKTGNSTYQSKMANYAEDFYDVCTKHNVNPAIAYAHACLETGYGGSIPDNNYFGMAVYNGQSSGRRYSSPKDSIDDYCKWLINNATIGTSAYSQNVRRAEEWGKENEKLLGTPDNNIYALYCRYAYLGDKHFCDDDMNNPKGTDYYSSHGSNWGKGGRIYIYEMYEKGGLFTGQYKTLCGHANASDPTTIRERADYVEYTTNKRINIANTIFGESTISEGGNIQSSNVSGEILEVAEDTFNKIVKTDKKPYNQYSSHTIQWPYTSSSIDCSSFLGVVLYRLGYTEFQGAQKNSSWWYYNSDATIKKHGWQTFYIKSRDDIKKLQPGDILAYNGTVTGNYAGYNFSGSSRNHVQIVHSIHPEQNKVWAWDCGYYPVKNRLGPDTSCNVYFWGFHGKKGVKVIRIIDTAK